MRGLLTLICFSAGCTQLLGIESLEESAPDGAPTDAAGDDPIAVNVSVTRGGLPAAGLDVVSHGRDGALAELAVTRADGTATLLAPPGGMVSLLAQAPDEAGVFELFTWTEIAAGDAVVFDITPSANGMSGASMQFGTPPPGTGQINFFASCISGSTLSFADLLFDFGPRCIGSDGLLAGVGRALDSNGALLAVTRAVSTVGGGPNLALTDWSSAGVAVIGQSFQPPPDSTIDLFEHRADLEFFVANGFTGRVVPGFAELYELRMTTNLNGGGGGGGGSSGELVFSGFSADLAVNLESDEFIEDIASVSLSIDPRPRVSFDLSQPDVDAVGIRLEFSGPEDPELRLRWEVTADPASGGVTLPAFPDGLAIQPADFLDFRFGNLRVFAATDVDGYRSFRAGRGFGRGMTPPPPRLESFRREREVSLSTP